MHINKSGDLKARLLNDEVEGYAIQFKIVSSVHNQMQWFYWLGICTFTSVDHNKCDIHHVEET